MHGIPTIVGSELYRGRHIFWSCVVCVMAFLLGTVIYFQMRNYYDYPTVTSVDVRYVGENDFPAVTFCDLNYFDGKFVRKYLDNYTTFHLTRLTEITGFYHRFFEELFDKVEQPVKNQSSDLLIQKLINRTLRLISRSPMTCSWGDHYWTPCLAATPRVTEMGVCFTVDVRKLAREKSLNETSDDDSLPAIGNALRGLTLYVDVSDVEIPNRIFKYQGFKAVLHEPDEEPLPLSSGFLVTGGTTVEVEISKTVKIGLPTPYKAFGSGSCVDTKSSSFENPLKRFGKYSKEICEAECFINFVVEVCGGCKHFLHAGNESICAMDHLADCYRDAEKKYYGGHLNGTKGRGVCKCPMPCTQSTYQASVTTSPFKETQFFADLKREHNMTGKYIIAYIHLFYSDPVVSEMRQVAVFSTEGLLGNIGGQIGLFMGFSLVSVAEMLELIFLLVTRGRNLDERVKKHKKSEAAVKAALQA
ncbi:unnamed protein product [Candidula unifasciata]|uniref:Uncharacterized protein n=1 Tax=Candidula unifasciata TaxID=100452 RepID=A0A8S4A2D1_9EUPU|nr:unnamed protein product [Candidula unifasciata]